MITMSNLLRFILYIYFWMWLFFQSCHMCGCFHGVLRCDPVRCPPVTCSVPTIQPLGQCCPICTSKLLITEVWNVFKILLLNIIFNIMIFNIFSSRKFSCDPGKYQNTQLNRQSINYGFVKTLLRLQPDYTNFFCVLHLSISTTNVIKFCFLYLFMNKSNFSGCGRDI